MDMKIFAETSTQAGAGVRNICHTLTLTPQDRSAFRPILIWPVLRWIG